MHRSGDINFNSALLYGDVHEAPDNRYNGS